MDDPLGDRIAADTVRQDTGTETRHDFAHLEIMCTFQDIVIDQNVVPEHLCLLPHILKETTHTGSQVEDMGWLVL